MNEVIINAVSDILVKGVLPLVLSGVSIYGGHLLFKLKTKLNNDNVKMALDQLTKITISVVQSLNQTMVADIKAKRTLTKEDEQAIKAKAVYLVKSQMQNEFLDILEKNTINVDDRISTEIESQVFEAKSLGLCNN
jgi:hypothetical protein